MAADAIQEVAQGRDPADSKKAQKAKAAAAAVNSLQFVCEECFKREHGKLQTTASREALLGRLVFPALGDRKIDSIKRSEIVRLLDRIEDNSGAQSAELALQYMRRIMGWYTIRDDDFRPLFVRGMSRNKNLDHARSRVLSDDEIRLLCKATEAESPFPALVRFPLLTGARRSEGAGITWKKISDGLWIVPAAKNITKIAFVRP